jgi:hypothetical protein
MAETLNFKWQGLNSKIQRNKSQLKSNNQLVRSFEIWLLAFICHLVF